MGELSKAGDEDGASAESLDFWMTAHYRLALSLALGVFLALFLLFFQPFGVTNYEPNFRITAEFVIVIGVFGLIVCGASLLNEFFIRPPLIRHATPGKVVVWSAWTCLLLSQVVFLAYNVFGNWHDFRLFSALGFLVNCSAVFVFPLVGTFFYFSYHDLRRRLDRAIRRSNKRHSQPRMLTFEGQGSGDRLTVRSEDFLFARAQDNYAELNHLKDGQARATLVRSTLAALAEQVPPPLAVRCHRSYLVNLRAVSSVHGPRNALRLQLRGVSEPVPVSRGFAAELESMLDATD